MAAQLHLGTTRSGSGLIIAQRATRHEGNAPAHRFRPRGHGIRRGKRSRTTTRTFMSFMDDCRMPWSIGGLVMTIYRNCKLNWMRHNGTQTRFMRITCTGSHNSWPMHRNKFGGWIVGWPAHCGTGQSPDGNTIWN